MVVYNTLKINPPVEGDILYLIRYSQINHPDYINVTYKNVKDYTITYINNNGFSKKISYYKAEYRLFSNIDEMARVLYDCFNRRDVILTEEYKLLCLISQENRPELWV